MSKPHKHAELIKAWADGAIIQQRHLTIDNGREKEWTYFDGWWGDDDIDNGWEYRIKPEPKPDVIAVGIVEWDGNVAGSSLASYYTKFRVLERHEYANIKFTFDGETGELKSAEVLK